ncbi:Amidase [Penicillium camemberti]|uniref:Amidase n=1 Tax=Penicillium camemberti (strain FM 013) TaxID=1429867 RepID=A0A0G4PAV1_PENC3|nr:Amidase [Penicillium camemberti]
MYRILPGRFSSFDQGTVFCKVTRKHTIDVLTATASDLRNLLDLGEVSSVELVGLHLDQIARHNKQGLVLNAMISTASADRVLEEARMLDTERAQKGPRSKLHGIPIILKEWGNSKGFGVTSGWSAVGGQTQSPYVKGGVDPEDRWMGHSTPAGSSSGSAVATAAGFAPLTIGSEANGSIVQPAIRAGAYSLKGTVGDVIMKGTQSGGAAFDSAGPIGKSAEDRADVMDILLPGRDFSSHLTKSWNGIRIAYLDYKTWQFPESVCEKTRAFDTQHELEMLEALKKVESLGAQTVTMGEIGNQPSQEVLENALNDNMTDEEYHSGLAHLRQSVRHAVHLCLEESNADVIMASGETLLPSIAACAGYPIGSVPLGFSIFNGRPFGMEIMSRNGEEEKIFQVISAWEATFPEARQPPPLLVNWASKL